jgi:hypothetical protein
MNEEYIVTKDWLLKHKTKRGAYTKEQILAVGLKYPLITGWMDDLVGVKITSDQAARFEDGKTIFTPAGKKYKKRNGRGKNYLSKDHKVLIDLHEVAKLKRKESKEAISLAEFYLKNQYFTEKQVKYARYITSCLKNK